MRHNKDILWKGVLRWVLDDLLRFVFPDAEQVFDLNRRFVYLDKELAALDQQPGKKVDTRFADNLTKVYRKDGGEEWILVHVEVQDKTAAQDRLMFPERMFRYFYRCFDRHQKPVVAIAIFCGPDGKLLAGCYKYEFMNTRVRYEYNTICILDYPDAALEESDNPFAWVVLIAKKALLKGKDLDKRMLEGKLRIFRKVRENGVLNRSKVEAILTFLNNYILFEKPETIFTFNKEIDKITSKKNSMDLMSEIAAGKKLWIVVRNLLTQTSFSDEQISKLADVTLDYVKYVKKNVRKKK